jgi:hypothetical protein
MKNFIQKIPEIYLNLFEKKLAERLIFLFSVESSHEELDKYINIIKFLHKCEILTLFSMNLIKYKIEKMEKLTPKLFSFFMKINASNSQIKI